MKEFLYLLAGSQDCSLVIFLPLEKCQDLEKASKNTIHMNKVEGALD